MYRRNLTKAKLLEGETVYGFIHCLAHAQVAEMIGQAGYDFVMIDGEHGSGGMSAHLACLQAVAATPATAILRVAGETLQRQYGAAAGQLLYEALDDAEREIDHTFGVSDDATGADEQCGD